MQIFRVFFVLWLKQYPCLPNYIKSWIQSSQVIQKLLQNNPDILSNLLQCVKIQFLTNILIKKEICFLLVLFYLKDRYCVECENEVKCKDEKNDNGYLS